MSPSINVEQTTVAPVSAKTVKVVEELLQKLNVSSGAEAEYAATNIASYVNTSTIEDLDTPAKLAADLKKQLASKKDAAARERALVAIKAIAEQSLAPATEAYLVQLLGPVLACVGIPASKKAADEAVFAIISNVRTTAIKAILPAIFNSIENSGKWQEKITALECLNKLSVIANSQLALRTPESIPVVSAAMWDTKKEVKAAAHVTMEKLCSLISNNDINKFIPNLIKCISNPENVKETVHLLGATTFVQDVQAPTLAIMVPLLERGLAERDTPIKRKSAVIVDNMCKLVEDPQIVAPFLSKLMPGLQKNYDNIADPEARSVTLRALDTLKRVGGVGADGKIPEVSTASDPKYIVETLKTVVSATAHKDKVAKMEPVLVYLACIAGTLYDEGTNEQIPWYENITPALAGVVGEEDAKTICESFRRKSAPGIQEALAAEADDEEGEDLCNCTFNLAYGAKILLNQTHLRLKRGQRYGLCGPNGSGKSTLMRAINQEQVEGFPPKSEVKTVFVEHDLDSADTEESVIGWTMKKLAEAGVTVDRKAIETQMIEFGFKPEQVDAPITSLSGGWRMKLALCRAVFEEPDILLLDEPTNHLDVVNVKWLEDYLCASKCTSIIVSHDSGFLDNVTQHIIHYERFKLKRYRGNLKAFVEKVPSAKSYYELGASEIEFKFPEPGFLEGVKTKAKAIVKMDNMVFQYPGTKKPQLTGISFQVSLGSRIAVIGPNGAGKSTLVNVLCGELIPTDGKVYVHENIRIAYIKQHAFQHIDNHLEMTPSEYIQWRFRTGEDAETLDRVSKKVTEDDLNAMNKIFKVDGSQRRVISISGRRKFKNSYEYECSFTLGENVGQKNEKWIPMSSTDNAWIPRGELINSHTKMVAEVDQKIAIESGNFRPLVAKEIEAHCANFGLDAELVSHSRMMGLSGGQRVKVCLAASTWLRPHLVVLDEPSNFLDRDSVGALSKALKAFEGGVVIITHSAELTRDITDEVWAVNDGKMTPSGHNWVQGQGSGPRLEEKEEGDKFDAMGNKLESKKKTKLTSSELRKKKKERMKKKKADPSYIDSDDDL